MSKLLLTLVAGIIFLSRCFSLLKPNNGHFRFGPQNPNLWIQALQLVGNIENQRAKEEHVGEILNTIEEQGLMSPLLVIRTLAGSPLANLGVVRQYLLNVYTTEQKQIKDHTAVIEQYR